MVYYNSLWQRIYSGGFADDDYIARNSFIFNKQDLNPVAGQQGQARNFGLNTYRFFSV